jgi:hypothetical protein
MKTFDINIVSPGGLQVDTKTFAGKYLVDEIRDWDKEQMMLTAKEYHIHPALTTLRRKEHEKLTDFTKYLN